MVKHTQIRSLIAYGLSSHTSTVRPSQRSYIGLRSGGSGGVSNTKASKHPLFPNIGDLQPNPASLSLVSTAWQESVVNTFYP